MPLGDVCVAQATLVCNALLLFYAGFVVLTFTNLFPLPFSLCRPQSRWRARPSKTEKAKEGSETKNSLHKQSTNSAREKISPAEVPFGGRKGRVCRVPETD